MAHSTKLVPRPKRRVRRRFRSRRGGTQDLHNGAGAGAGMPLFLQRNSANNQPTVQKKPEKKAPAGTPDECPSYDPGERRTSRTSTAHLDPDVTMLAPGKLLIADIGVNRTGVKKSTEAEPLLKTWLGNFEADPSYRISIVGYSDCVDDPSVNTALRHGRAEAVENLLGPSAKSRVDFRGMAALGNYVDNNRSTSTRARNRSVVITFHREFSFEPETVTSELCGPDVTQWLIDQMKSNKDHPVIKTNRENSWAWYIPFFNLGWSYGFLSKFRDLVKAGAPWDFKATQSFRSGVCPTDSCRRTVSICGICFDYDVPGNIHYGWVGRAGAIRRWFLHNRAAAAQKGGVDDPADSVAIDIGISMWDDGKLLCPQLRSKRQKLRRGSKSCVPCSEHYT